MKWSQVSSRFLGAAVGLSLLVRASAVFAFAEDICFRRGDNKPSNCNPLPAACQPVGTASPACLAAVTAGFIGENVSGKDMVAMRSMIHADSVNLLAQAAGFSAEDANWISAYGEVPDYGQFQPTDMAGQPYDGGAYKTAELNGFVRTSFSSGGMFYHYVSLYSGGSAAPPAGVDGLRPNTHAPDTEYFIAHVRRWAMAGSGASTPLCMAGLTNRSAAGDYATGNGCFAQSGNPAQVRWTWALLGPATQTYELDTGLQVINSANGSAVLASEFDTAVGSGAARAADARLGIYLHMLADRISHHACTDTSSIAGPSNAGKSTWTESETASVHCQQDYHALFHAWETGVELARVPAANRTTEAALDLLYDELVAFAAARGTARSGAGDSATKSALVKVMLSALQVEAADARITALAKVACDNGYQPFPGAPACSSARAGGDTGPSGSTIRKGGGGGACACSMADGPSPMIGGAAWLAGLAALLRRARRRATARR